jgi:hypothetical protein
MKKRSLKQRLRAKNLIRESPVVGVSWYSEEQWALVKASSTDPERFEASYSEWLAVGEDALRKLQLAGLTPVKVLVDSVELTAWCVAQGKSNEASARAQFVSEMMRSRSGAEA